MNRFVSIILNIYDLFVTWIWAISLGILVFLCFFSTCYIDEAEVTYFVCDNVALNFGAVLLFLLLIVIVGELDPIQKVAKRLERSEEIFQKCRRVLIITIFGIALLWVLATQYVPGADQQTILDAVYALHNKDYYMFAEDGYLARNPHQLGLVWICYLLSLVFGNYNYVVFQIINVLGITICYFELSIISGYLGLRRMGQLVVLMMGILFFPAIMYCSFVYGNILGFAFSLVAIRNEIAFFKELKWKRAFVSAVAITMAVILKTNYLVYLLAMIICAVTEAIRRKIGIYLYIVVMIAGLYFFQAVGVKAISEHITGTNIEGGSYWSYIAMGLQDGDRAPGWYNGYVIDSYVSSGFHTDVQATKSKLAIKTSLDYFIADKRNAVRFFTEKTASQWNNPTFQSFNIIQWRPAGITESNWVTYFTSANGEHLSVQCLNIFEVIVLLGALIYCLMNRTDKDYHFTLILALTFIGGFLFHLFWEAKGQYTIFYFVLLFPYAVSGYGKLRGWIAYQWLRRKCEPLEKKRFEWKCMTCLILITVTICCVVLYWSGCTEYLTADTDVYYTYLKGSEIS